MLLGGITSPVSQFWRQLYFLNKTVKNYSSQPQLLRNFSQIVQRKFCISSPRFSAGIAQWSDAAIHKGFAMMMMRMALLSVILNLLS